MATPLAKFVGHNFLGIIDVMMADHFHAALVKDRILMFISANRTLRATWSSGAVGSAVMASPQDQLETTHEAG